MAQRSTAQQQERSQLEALLKTWEARWRTRKLVLYFPRALMGVLALALIVTLVLVLLQTLTPPSLIILIIGGVVIGAVGAALALRFSGKDGIESARHFDEIFGMHERVSTAFELIDGRIQTIPELASAQVEDALSVAQHIDPKQMIQLENRWKEWAGAFSLLLVLGTLLGIYTLIGYIDPQTQIAVAAQAAINQAADEVRDITEEVVLDGGLENDERQALLESLEVSLDELNDETTSPEEAFIELGELETQLRETAENIREENTAQDQDLQAAAESLQNLSNRPDLPEAGDEANASQQMQDALEQLQNELDSMTPEQREQLQQQLEEAAEGTSDTAPAVSESLSELADALNSAETQEMQDSLQEALDQLQTLEGQKLERLETAEKLEDSADQVQRSSEELSEAEQNNAESEETGEETGQSPESAQAPGGQSPSESDEQNQNTSESGSPILSDDPSGQSVEIQGQADTPPSDADAASDSPQSESGGGSGEGEGNQQDTISGPQNSQDSNQADGEGVTEYQGIFVGENINVNGSVNVELEADASDSPTIEGDFQENPIGEANVPYNQVFQSYQDAANHALENDYVPLGMRDVVRDYFTSIAPASNPTNP